MRTMQSGLLTAHVSVKHMIDAQILENVSDSAEQLKLLICSARREAAAACVSVHRTSAAKTIQNFTNSV